jgi:type IV secretory pathway VirB4 component
MSEDEKILLGGSHFNVVFFSDSAEEHKLNEKLLSNAFKNMDIKPYAPENIQKQNLFFNSFFANVANINKPNIIEPFDIQQSLCFFTNVTNYKNDDKGIFFNDRIFNIPVRKDIWDEDKQRIKARNFFIVAPTGEGKSVLANHIFRQLFEDDIRIVIIDLGDSYRKLSLLYPEDTVYIKYQDGVSLGLNPFYVDSTSEISSAKVNELSTFVFKLWKRDRLPEEDEAVSLRKIINLYYKHVDSGHCFPQFYEFILNNRDEILKILDINASFFDVDDFLHITSEFIGEGIYSFMFDNVSDSSHKIEGKKFIIFELDEVKDNHILLTIMLHMISEAVQKIVWKDRSTKGVIFFDEFAKMLKFPTVLSTAEYFYQAARKQEAAIGIVLQSPSQLPKTDSANSIIDNTQVMYIMQNEKGYKDIIERFSLKSHDENQLGSIKYNFTGKIKYSEFLLKIGNESNIVRLELAKEVLLAFQTEGKEYTEIMNIYKETKDMQKAIEIFSNLKN